MGSIPAQGTKIPCALGCSQKVKKKKKDCIRTRTEPGCWIPNLSTDTCLVTSWTLPRIHTYWGTVLCCAQSLSCVSLQPHGLEPTRFLSPQGFSRQEYQSGLPCPPPGDLSNPCLLHCRWILYHLSHQQSPRIPEWVAYPIQSLAIFFPRLLFFLIYFNWRIITLQYCDGFCHTST